MAREELAGKSNKEIKDEDFSVKLIEEKKGWLGFGNKDNIYEIELKKEKSSVNEKDERFLEMAADDISIDGDYKFRINEDGVFINVIPPQGEGDPIHYQVLKNKLNQKGIVEVDWQAVQEAVHAAEEEWVKIAPRKPELDSDGKIKVKMSKDKLRAYIDYYPAQGGKKLTFDDLLEILHAEGVNYGIKKDNLKDIVEHRKQQQELLIARGKKPVSGKDGELIYHFEEQKDSIGTEREDGSINFYDLGLINNVQPGDILVTVKDPIPGEPGIGVDGEEIEPEEPKECQLPSGKNVKKNEEGSLVAEIAGQVVKDDRRVNVLPIHQINGNVDLSTGNIDFVGNVHVKGDVTEGFEIKAEGNVEIRGNVSAGKIISGGEVVIHKGFIGKEKGIIKAKGDVKVKFVENGFINSKGSIIVADAVMHSQLNARSEIKVAKNKGLLVGGRCRAGQRIEANVIGSSLATNTRLEAGINPELKKRITELEEELEEEQQNMLKTRKALRILGKMKRKKGLPRDKKKMYQKLSITKERLEKSINKNEREYEKLQDEVRKLSKGRVKVNSKVFPGVKIIIGNSQCNVQEELRHSNFVEEEGEIKQISL